MKQNDLNLPWKIICGTAFDANESYIGNEKYDPFIVLAANNHHALVEALTIIVADGRATPDEKLLLQTCVDSKE